ncbi:hypothetical protein K3Z90_06960 [Pseudomonas aeruginosa]|uniref:hypothetical protein n=1 Tax=Pseudomonas aeruginosa TaxID=287 RepID=UPI00211B5BE6|nr:hypothetical protein [Pseudomonas aeruginosa]MCR3790939.1 hypothetical protein [Pseudomonas aeruginosa]
MNKANECTCPSGDGSLVHPCPAHPAVEQAGGDERAAFELFVRKHCGMPEHIAVNWDAKFTNDAWEGWQARAALAQPSPKSGDYSDQSWINAGCPPEQPEQAEAERPEVVARVVHSNPVVLGQCGPLNANDELMTVAQHAASVARWAEMFNRVEQQRDAALAEVERLREENANLTRACASLDSEKREMEHKWDAIIAMRDAALARVAELERQEPVATVAKVPGEDWNSLDFHRDLQDMQPGTKLYAAPVAQAQQLNDLDKQCRDDVARALGLRPNQERGFAWSYLLASIKSCVKASGDSAQAQHSVPEGWMLVECGIWTQEQVDEMQKTVTRFRNSEFVDDRALAMAVADAGQCKAPEISLAELLAAAPGNSVPQAWLDVQAERRRQITAEGWTPEHDDEHADGQMAQAAGCYALHAGGIGTDWPDGRQNGAALFWPWDKDSWKPTTPRRDLVKACALALAEIERLDRAGISQSPQPGATTASS